MPLPDQVLTAEEARQVRDNIPVLSNRTPGIDLPTVLRRNARRFKIERDAALDAWLGENSTLLVDNSKPASTENDGSSDRPFASIGEALEVIPDSRTSGKTITLSLVNTGEPYALPAADPLHLPDRVKIVGSMPDPVSGLSAVAIDTVSNFGPEHGGSDLELTLTGRSADDLVGYFVEYSGGRRGWVFDSGNTSGTTPADITQDRDAGPQNPAGNTLAFFDPADMVQIDLNGNDLGLNRCNLFEFEQVSFVDTDGSGGSKIVIQGNSPRLKFRNCHFAATLGNISVFEHGGLTDFWNCYFANVSGGAKFGQVGINHGAGSSIRFRSGCVFDGGNSGSNNYPIVMSEGVVGGGLYWQGGIVLRDCKAINLHAHTMLGYSEAANTNRAVYVIDHDASSPIIALGGWNDSDNRGGRQGQQLPALYGSIDHDYCVEFKGCSPRLSRFTDVTCDASGSPVTNQISGDNGDSACCGTAWEDTWATLERDPDTAGWETNTETPASASPTIEIDGKNGRYQEIDLTGSTGTPTVNFSQMQKGGYMTLLVTQAASALTITWTDVDWAGGTAPSIGNGATGMIRIHWDGTTLRGEVVGNSFS